MWNAPLLGLFAAPERIYQLKVVKSCMAFIPSLANQNPASRLLSLGTTQRRTLDSAVLHDEEFRSQCRHGAYIHRHEIHKDYVRIVEESIRDDLADTISMFDYVQQ